MGKKAGEKLKPFLAHFVFIAIILLGAYFIITNSMMPTGYAVIDAESANDKLKNALISSAMFSSVASGNICVIINDPEQSLSLQAQKTSLGWTISEMPWGCAGQYLEDAIIQFPDYDSFSRIINDPTPRNLATAAMTQQFQILPSAYVESGGNVICDGAFKVKFCPALKNMGSNSQLIDADLVCCIDTLAKEDKKQLESHLANTNFRDEIGILQKPSSGAIEMLKSQTTIIFIGAAGFILLIGIVFIAAKGKKTKESAKPDMNAQQNINAPAATLQDYSMQQGNQTYARTQTPIIDSPEVIELKNYVAGVIRDGYDPSEVRAHLLEIGWSSEIADKVLSEAEKN